MPMNSTNTPPTIRTKSAGEPALAAAQGIQQRSSSPGDRSMQTATERGEPTIGSSSQQAGAPEALAA